MWLWAAVSPFRGERPGVIDGSGMLNWKAFVELLESLLSEFVNCVLRVKMCCVLWIGCFCDNVRWFSDGDGCSCIAGVDGDFILVPFSLKCCKVFLVEGDVDL